MHRNGLQTAALLGSLSALLLWAGHLVAGPAGLLAMSVLSLALNGYAYANSARIVLRSMHARPVGEAEAPGLYRIVRELSTAARQPMPALYMSPRNAPNAFATGRCPRDAAVCVTEGLLVLLDERELRGVLGHELAHVHDRDLRTASVAASFAGVLLLPANLWWLRPTGDSDDDRGGFIATIFLLVLGPVASCIVRPAISRSREFGADASAVRLTRDPLALASALRKLDAGARACPLPAKPDLLPTGALMIADPFRAGGFSALFCTHPPMLQRVARLEDMAAVRR